MTLNSVTAHNIHGVIIPRWKWDISDSLDNHNGTAYVVCMWILVDGTETCRYHSFHCNDKCFVFLSRVAAEKDDNYCPLGCRRAGCYWIVGMGAGKSFKIYIWNILLFHTMYHSAESKKAFKCSQCVVKKLSIVCFKSCCETRWSLLYELAVRLLITIKSAIPSPVIRPNPRPIGVNSSNSCYCRNIIKN